MSDVQKKIEEEAERRYKAHTPETHNKFVAIFHKVFISGAQFALSMGSEWVKDEPEVEPEPVQIGTLNKRWGMNGFTPAEIGHPVYEHKDRYLFYLKPLNGGKEITITFYKETLSPVIQFTPPEG